VDLTAVYYICIEVSASQFNYSTNAVTTKHRLCWHYCW